MSQPSYTIGRYEVAGHLATGGMAEILLGRLVGPAGFERPVVIKRILPHLAREASFVAMFLDEARIAARIAHPNVVQVYELYHGEDALCIVMEYLEGESLAGLMRRLKVRQRRLDPALSSHVIAQAAAGLHAAHELKDADGNDLALVHRDVSPQNIFVGYDGSVKVLDFGIAVVKDRTTRTRTGHLRGKFEYMSPEQCQGRPLDRRADLFSLGTVLYELSTGTQLFKRRNELLILKAIVDDRVVPPSTFCPDFPLSLERVVLRALQRGRSARYQTAAEMRRDLVAVSRELGPTVVGEYALAELMRDLFADRIDEKHEMLRRLRAGSSLTQVPAAEADAAVDLPLVTDVGPEQDAESSPSRSLSSVPPRARAEPARGRWLLGAFAALGLGGMTFASASLHEGAGPSPAITSTTAPRLPPAAPQPSRDITLRVDSTPPGARLTLAGQPRGSTPLSVKLPRSREPLDIELNLDGYRSLGERIVPDVDQRLHLVLEPSEPPRQPRPLAPVKPQAAKKGYHRFN